MKKMTLLFFLLNISFLFAQKEVSGVVKDNAGATLPGVNVIEKGTKNGVSTDMDGNYKIKVNEGATLVFSYIGYKSVSKVATDTTIDVVLSGEGEQELKEVQIVGSRNSKRTSSQDGFYFGQRRNPFGRNLEK